MHNVQFTRVSANRKTGPIPVTTSASATCPDACPFKSSNAGGCYAAGGPIALLWRKVDSGAAGMPRDEFLSAVRKLPKGQLWRHNQAGDLPGAGDAIDGAALRELVHANNGRRGFTYTHKPMTSDNRFHVQLANEDGFTINLSANSLEHADELAALDIAPVAAVIPADMGRRAARKALPNGDTNWLESIAEWRARIGKVTTPAGRPVTVCPATFRDDVSCATCGLCQLATRRAVVAFPAHGASKARASRVANGGK